MPTDPTTSPTPPEPDQSASALLNNLIGVLLNKNPSFEKWLDAIRTPIEQKQYAIAKIGEIIRLSAKTGLELEVTRRLITTIVENDELNGSAQKIQEFSEAIYVDEHQQKVNITRRRQGLPPLK